MGRSARRVEDAFDSGAVSRPPQSSRPWRTNTRIYVIKAVMSDAPRVRNSIGLGRRSEPDITRGRGLAVVLCYLTVLTFKC
jgi:hypothetical protein